MLQICELQQELDKLRNYEQTASKLQEVKIIDY